MAIDNKVVVNWIANNLTGTINIPGSDFEEKEIYTLKVTISDTAGNEAIYIFDVVNALGHYPALCVNGAEVGMGETGWMFYALGLGPCVLPLISLRNITTNITFTLRSTEGDNDRYNVVEVGGDIKSLMIQRDLGASYINVSTGVNIEADFPLFMGTHSTYSDANLEGDLYDYEAAVQGTLLSEIALAGDYTNIGEAINNFDEVDTIPRDKIYFIRNTLKCNNTVVSNKHYRFRIPPNAKIWLVAEEHDNSGQTYNMFLHMSGLGLPPTFLWQIGGSGSSWNEGHLITVTLGSYYYGNWTDYNNGDLYKVVGGFKAGNTNIPVFASEAEGDAYGDGLIGEDKAINSGDLGYDGQITTGDDLSSSDIPNPVIAGSGAGVNVWLLDKGNLNSIFSDLYSTTQSVIDDIQKGTWLWGNNPIDFIVSIYYVPFDVSNFYDTTTERVWLGQYDTGHDYTQCKESKSSGQRITLVNTTIDNVYGDFRDIDYFKYDLYLPYVGFIPLDPNVYVGHELKIEMAFDVMTHNFRYYLFVDGVVTDRVDGSVGYDIPVTGTDMVNKARNNMNGLINTVKGGAELAAGVSSGNIAQGFAGGTTLIGGIQQGFSYPKEIIRGDISSSMNIYDINYVYLKITEKQSIYPNEIKQLYNNPSYVAGPISNLSGYCELANARISSYATEPEIEEIQSLLRSGVIL